MGILDEAIREHLDLKRQHGAEESELDGLEADAFGPADRPNAVEPETEVISQDPGSTPQSGEGDQLDRIFEESRLGDETAETRKPTGEAAAPTAPDDAAEASDEEETAAEHILPTTEPAAEADAKASPPVPDPEPEADDPYDDDEGGDAGDALQRERMSLLSTHPTEHYDVDAAIAEEQEIDILSESSLSDELDRALDGPDDARSAEPSPPAAGEESAGPAEAGSPEEPVSDEFDSVFDDEPESAQVADKEEEAESPEATEPAEEASEGESGGKAAEPTDGESDQDSEFFDQDDPLEATPEFLEETPEHDRLWFEQKEPKDFDFGD